MRAEVSFHPVDPDFFESMIGALAAGQRVKPEEYLSRALRLRRNAARSRRYSRGLEAALERMEAPETGPYARKEGLRGLGGALAHNLKSRFDKATYRPDEVAQRVAELIEPELHCRGRPFFITEKTPERVAEIADEYASAADAQAADSLALEQLVVLDPKLARQIAPGHEPDLVSDLTYRNDLLDALKWVYDTAGAARRGEQQAKGLLAAELPWRALWVQSRAMPFWTAENVDGLETLRRAAGIPEADFLIAPRRLFAAIGEEFPEVTGALGLELDGSRSVGAFVPSDELPALIDFLTLNGARLIRAASRQGAGAACRVALGKMRECAVYAQRRGFGYLEATGIEPPEQEPDD